MGAGFHLPNWWPDLLEFPRLLFVTDVAQNLRGYEIYPISFKINALCKILGWFAKKISCCCRRSKIFENGSKRSKWLSKSERLPFSGNLVSLSAGSYNILEESDKRDELRIWTGSIPRLAIKSSQRKFGQHFFVFHGVQQKRASIFSRLFCCLCDRRY